LIMKDKGRKLYSGDFRTDAGMLVEILSAYLEKIKTRPDETPVLPGNEPERLLEKYQKILNSGMGLKEFFSTLIDDSNHLHHRGYTGHQCAVTNPVTALSSMAAAILNNGSAVYEMGPVNVVMERIVARYFSNAFNYPADADGLFTSGGSLGNLTALLAARQNQSDYDIWDEGVRSGDQPAFMIPESSHYCIPRAIKIMGLGEKGLIRIPVDHTNRMKTEKLDELYNQATAEGKRVIALVANACSTATGSYDDLEKAGAFCRKNKLWFHIDGAHGGAAILSEKYKYLLNGSEFADSIVIDFHKMLKTPGLNTLILFRDGKKSWSTFAQKASYLLDETSNDDWFNYAKRTMECTKSMMGLNVYIQLLSEGENSFSDHIDRLFDLGKDFSGLIEKTDYMELALQPEANIVCFRFNDGKEDLDVVNSSVRDRILKNGNFYIVQTVLQGEVFLRVSLMNPQTTPEDLQELLNEVKKTGLELRRK